MKEKETFVKNALSEFLMQHSAAASLGDIDDVVLAYMISILEELGNSSCSEETFDVEQFAEMMDAYLPGFHSFNSIMVSEWMFELAAKLVNHCSSADRELKLVNHEMSSAGSSYSAPPKTNVVPCSLVSSGNEQLASSNDEKTEFPESVDLLSKMFPGVSIRDIARVVSSAAGDLDISVDHLLELQNERGDCQHLMEASCQVEVTSDSANSAQCDLHLKKTILEKYSYVDTEEDKRSHRPTVPKQEPKKLTRYLDGRVVNVKGDKFTEIKKPEDESMKSTYINLKPARQYRFH